MSSCEGSLWPGIVWLAQKGRHRDKTQPELHERDLVILFFGGPAEEGSTPSRGGSFAIFLRTVSHTGVTNVSGLPPIACPGGNDSEGGRLPKMNHPAESHDPLVITKCRRAGLAEHFC